jgi:hypothetical protein
MCVTLLPVQEAVGKIARWELRIWWKWADYCEERVLAIMETIRSLMARLAQAVVMAVFAPIPHADYRSCSAMMASYATSVLLTPVGTRMFPTVRIQVGDFCRIQMRGAADTQKDVGLVVDS